MDGATSSADRSTRINVVVRLTLLRQIPASERSVLGAGLAVALLPIALYTFASAASQISMVVAGYALGTIPFLWVCLFWRDLGDERSTLIRVLVTALICRLGLLYIPPILSEDLWRYIWDGMHIWSGLSPYTVPPNAPSEDIFSSLHQLSDVRAQIGHSEISTIYPPTAQLSFAIATSLGPSVLGMRLLMISADLVTIGALWTWATSIGRPPQVAALYAFAPIAMMESSVGAHIDSVGVAALTLGAALYVRRRTLGSALAVVWAIGVKIVPVFILLHWFRNRWRLALFTFGLASSSALLFFSLYPAGSDGVATYAHRWRANDGIFSLVYSIFEWLWPNHGTQIEVGPFVESVIRLVVGGEVTPGFVWPDELAFGAAKVCAGIIFVVSLLFALVRARTVEGFWLWVMGTLLLISPVVHPWYLLWVLPSAALILSRERGGWGWVFVLWSQLVWLAYLPRQAYVVSGVWSEPTWARWLQYLPVFILISVLCVKHLVADSGGREETGPEEELDVSMTPEDG